MSIYDLGASAPETTLEPGTNVLLSGDRELTRSVAVDILTEGFAAGQATILVSTDEDAETVRGRLEAPADATVGVVDCVTRGDGTADVSDDQETKYAASPADLTGIGIKLSSFLEDFYELQGLESRVALDSVSTVLAENNLETVFRFLHVFTRRIEAADALGVYTVQPDGHSPQTMRTLRQLFDLEATVEDGDVTLRRLASE